LLEAYCRHIVNARKVASLIDQLETAEGEFDHREWSRLFSLQDRQNRAISDLAMKMRLSQSSRYDAKKSRGQGGVGSLGLGPRGTPRGSDLRVPEEVRRATLS
jgi:hypothetical protein